MKFKRFCKAAFAMLIAVIMIISVLPAVDTQVVKNVSASAASYTMQAYTGSYSSVNGTYGGVDDLGRYLTADYETTAPRAGRYVGIFYFLWQGEHGTSGPHDNTKIVASNPNAINSEANWIAAGGGAQGAHHFWGEPLFGYYKSDDTWVMRKHVQMLTDAGVDYICFDATNGYTYTARVKQLIGVWYEYLLQGYNVPKLVFYTNTNSGATMNSIYNDIYNNASLKSKYPRLDELWFNWDGKPLIIGNSADTALSSEAKNYFRIKANQWPNEARKADGFPWMEFSRLLNTSSVYGLNGRKEVMNVSIAQHNATIRFSATAWYGGNDRTRSYHNGANDKSANAYMYGYNFGEQWNYAIKQDPEMVFVTGWNEWVAQRQPVISGQPIVFVDCADYNTSRDAEPMRGYYGDNYYMQLIDYIRQYKGTISRVFVGNNTTIDISGDFTQWDASAITARYTDYRNDTINRNTKGFGDISYVDTTGRNDIVAARAAKDASNFYFYVETASDITARTDNNWMTLFLSVNNNDNPNWYGYNYAVNIGAPKNATTAYLYQSQGGWDWANVGTVQMKVSGNKMMIAVPRSAIAATDNLFHLEFKWADNYTDNDIWSFYEHGDAAPCGRMNYVFSNSKKVANSSGGDTGNPIAKDIKITQNSTSYTITCTVDDDNGISAVYYPTWTTENGQDDIKWIKATVSGRTATATISITDYDGKMGEYVSHIYVDDKSGNRSFAGAKYVWLETTAPVITNVKITDLSASGYTVSCTVTDDALDRVLFPTWTIANGQDDIIWYKGTISGTTATCRINASSHNNETGNYTTHIYAYDTSNNSSSYNCSTIVVKNYIAFELNDTGSSIYTLDRTKGYLSGVPERQTAATIAAGFACEVEIYKIDGLTKMASNDIIATGCVVVGMDTDENLPKVTVVIKGDNTGDGMISALDQIALKNYLKKNLALKGAYLEASDINGDADYSALDYIALKQILTN